MQSLPLAGIQSARNDDTVSACQHQHQSLAKAFSELEKALPLEVSLRPLSLVGVDVEAPQRLHVLSAHVIASDRLAYWELNHDGGEAALAKLGLQRRRSRMP